MRAIEAEILSRRMKVLSAESRDREDLRSVIPLKNFFGIEIKNFACEIARLSLLIAEYQCDVDAMGQERAGEIVLPLKETGRIKHGNALRLDWLEVCPPPEQALAVEKDLDGSTERPALEPSDDGGWETYICGNPPYLGSKWQSSEQKGDLGHIFDGRTKGWKSLDYVSGWFVKAADYGRQSVTVSAFVSTNSICQGQQVPILWPLIIGTGHEIVFAHTSFKWANLASHNAGVTVAIVGISNNAGIVRKLFTVGDDGDAIVRETNNINPYLVSAPNLTVGRRSRPVDDRAVMQFGNHPYYGAALIFSHQEGRELVQSHPKAARFVRPLYGSKEFITATPRACLWIESETLEEAEAILPIARRIADVEKARRAATRDQAAQKLADTPYRFRDQSTAKNLVMVVPRVSSENRKYLPVGLLPGAAIIQDQSFALYDARLWNMALIASRLHLVWIATVCGKLKTDFRYSNTLGWNTFPVPALTEKNKTDLTRCAEDILLAREHYFPATIADMYDPDRMDKEFPLVREAHKRNDEVLERIYIGRRFKNDTERLEKLFDLYTKMTASENLA